MSTLGVVFHYQGKSMLGPQSSFMYANPEWIFYGIEIFALGIVAIGASITVRLLQIKYKK